MACFDLNNFVAVEEAKRVEGLLELCRVLAVMDSRQSNRTHLSHGIHGLVSQFFPEIFSFLQTHSVLASDCPIHGNSTSNHAMDQCLSGAFFRIVVQQNGYSRLSAVSSTESRYLL